MIATVFKWLTGGVLGRILDSVDKSINNETERQKIRSEAVVSYVRTQEQSRQVAMQSRVFWLVWALFAVPLAVWWAAVMLDTTFDFAWSVADLPDTVKPWANIVFGSIFGSGAGVAGVQLIAAAIQRR